jgi:hypothetical protein
MITKVKVDFFKNTGKYYTSIEFNTDTQVWDTDKLNNEVHAQVGFIGFMLYTMEATNESGIVCNKRLYGPTITPSGK